MKSIQERVGWFRMLRGGFLIVALVVVLFPYLWVLASSLKTKSALTDPTRVMFDPTFQNWFAVLGGEVPTYFLTSLLIGFLTVGISLLVATPAAYSISHYRTGGRLGRFGILISEVMPPAVLVVPIFLIAYFLRLNDTMLPIIAAHLTFVLPVMTWFLIGFFDAVPKEYEEQARVDGYGRLAAFWKVVLPQVLPGLGAASIFGFVLSWNDLFYALILAGGNTKTLPVAIAGYNTFRGIKLGEMSVAILVAVIPVLVLSFFVQRRLIQGIGGGGL